MALIKKAAREKVKVKALLMSPSGAGKTYSALRLAKGMGGKTLLIDTEAGRGLYYADEFEYDYVELKEIRRSDPDFEEYKTLLPRYDEPFAPENYIALISYAVDNEYDNLIIDSLTHEWNSKGGILDSLNKMANVKNDMQKWATQTPRHNDFLYAILHSPINVIATVRGKDEYVIEENQNGKKVPRKIGLGAVQRDGIEFEYTVTFLIDQETHIATAQKDNTHIFEGKNDILSEEYGIRLLEWANSGVTSNRSTEFQPKDAPVSNVKINELKTEVISLATLKGGSKNETVMTTIKAYAPTGNPNSLKDATKLKNLIEDLKKLPDATKEDK